MVDNLRSKEVFVYKVLEYLIAVSNSSICLKPINTSTSTVRVEPQNCYVHSQVRNKHVKGKELKKQNYPKTKKQKHEWLEKFKSKKILCFQIS